MTEGPTLAPLLEAVDRYFTLMYDNDVSQFDRVLRRLRSSMEFATRNCGYCRFATTEPCWRRPLRQNPRMRRGFRRSC